MNVDFAELDDRILKCQKILDADPQSQIFAALAEAYRKKRDIQKAFDICIKGLEIHPDYASAYIVLTKIYIDQNNFIEADSQLQNAINVGGRTRSVDLLQSEIYIKLGQKEKARSILEKLLKSDPQNETIKNLLVSVDRAASASTKPETMPELKPVIRPEAFAEPGPVERSTSQPRKRSYTLSNALSIIKVLPRVLGVVAVGRDGIVIEGQFDGMLSKNELGALASGAFDAVAQGVGKIKLGQPREILVESEQSKLWIYNRDKMLIVISMRDDVNLGSLRLKVSEIFKNTEYT